MEIQEIIDNVLRCGPTKIFIFPDNCISPAGARRQGIKPDIIFLRDDGWSLGAPAYLENKAYHLWKGYWIGFIRVPDTQVIPIEEYRIPQ